jgi:hypothetical protein
MWERIKAWFKHSATILWARIVGLGGFVLAALDATANLFELPGIRENIQLLLDPKYVPYYIIAIALMTELARRRTLKKDAG